MSFSSPFCEFNQTWPSSLESHLKKLCINTTDNEEHTLESDTFLSIQTFLSYPYVLYRKSSQKIRPHKNVSNTLLVS